MNLMEGTVTGGTFRAKHVEIPGLDAKDGPLTLGFRAEDASLAPEGQGQITAPIYTLELLGDATMISVRVGGALVSVKADKTFRAEIGDPVRLSVPPAICHLFDAETGERI
jgi:multiple sugar transport system ATP-binding protein